MAKKNRAEEQTRQSEEQAQTTTAEVIQHPGLEMRLPSKPFPELIRGFKENMVNEVRELTMLETEIYGEMTKTKDNFRRARDIAEQQRKDSEEFLKNFTG